jgi:glycosyltransferase involved in cell wall biosynthesis
VNSKGRNGCIVAYGRYPAPRKYREAMALRDNGYNVDVICIKMRRKDKATEVYQGVSVFRLPMIKNRSSQLQYLIKYSKFFILASIKLARLYFKKKYAVIQVHSMPDFLVFTALLPKLCGSKIILDAQDPTREVFMAKYSCKKNGIIVKIIELQEKLSFAFANKLITPNLGFKKKFVERGLKDDKMTIIMNTPDERIFKSKYLINCPEASQNGRFVLLFHGAVLERHGLDIAITAVKKLIEKIPTILLEVAGIGEQLGYNKNLVNICGLNDYVIFHNAVEQELIPELIMRSQVGLIPNRLNSFININLPQRIFEYTVYDVPVVIPKTSGVNDYFDENSLAFFKSEDTDDLAQKIYELYQDPQKRRRIALNARKIYEELKWDVMKQRYLEIIDRLDDFGSSV